MYAADKTDTAKDGEEQLDDRGTRYNSHCCEIRRRAYDRQYHNDHTCDRPVDVHVLFAFTRKLDVRWTEYAVLVYQAAFRLSTSISGDSTSIPSFLRILSAPAVRLMDSGLCFSTLGAFTEMTRSSRRAKPSHLGVM